MPGKLSLLVIIFFASFVFSCDNSGTTFKAQLPEIKRIQSKDKKVDAVLVRWNGGATVATTERVFIVKSGSKLSQDDLQYAVFLCDHFSKVDIKWKQPKQLLISYAGARIFSYTNFWESDDVDNYDYVVELFLNCTSNEQLSDSDRKLNLIVK